MSGFPVPGARVEGGASASVESVVTDVAMRHSRPRFAFVVHPLNPRQFYYARFMRVARRFPPLLVERAAAHAPPIYLSRMRRIRSTTTETEIDGILLTLGTTPREMMRRPPEFTYRRLLWAARIARRMGAQIMGLGAFTSVVGDAGETVARRSPIAITTGNSLTVAMTLEAVRQGLTAMGSQIEGSCAMVVGATGSIGLACARLLAPAVSRLILVSPRAERLLDVQRQIERETPAVSIITATDPAVYLHKASLVILATSALTDRLLNFDLLQPGTVVCDVARPRNVTPADAERRPDVLVVESGEIRLPGHADLGFNIDLPCGIAYACLAETALLALEERFEHYTVGRAVSPERVQEIHRLMIRHGFALAGLRSFGRFVSPEELALRRQRAASARQSGSHSAYFGSVDADGMGE